MRIKEVKGGQTTYFVYQGNNPLLEYTPSDGTYKYFIYAGNKLVAEETNGVVKYYHSDHLGSTRMVTDSAGNKVAEYKFAPYGEKEAYSGSFSTDYQFTGKPGIDEVGLSYFGARWYDPETGRFITQDPAKDGLNWYAYANNNPLKFVDPNGKNPVFAFLLGFAVGQSFSNPGGSPLEMLQKGCEGGLIAVGAYELYGAYRFSRAINSFETSYHAVPSSSAGQSVLNGVDKAFFNARSRFGGGFYVSNEAETTVAELAAHENQATQVIRYSMNLSNQKVLDFTNSSIAGEWGFSAKSTVQECQLIGSKAQALGYDVIAFPSFRGSGINFVIYDNFDDILQPQMISPVQ
ncbi:MAG TPA: RHS repeat-associated core domain-containing protein [Bacillota bacterium]|nr:RHS repeat-associated core domain-containing protein [Bacillota bacterium]